MLKSPALVNDSWTVIDITVTEGSKNLLLGGGGELATSTHNKWGCAILTRIVVPKNLRTYLKLTFKNLGTQNARLSFWVRKSTFQISTPYPSFTYFIKRLFLGWGQIDEHCWSNNVGWQKLNHLISHLNNVETCVINVITKNLYFGFSQTFHHVCVMTFTETDLSQTSNSSCSWTQEAVNMLAPCWKLLQCWYISGFKLKEDQEWAKINVKSTRDV